jgi:hypothetical protein
LTDREGSGQAATKKRAQMTRRYVIFFSSCFLCAYFSYIYKAREGSGQVATKKKGAQMTPDTSFGPRYVFFYSCFLCTNYFYLAYIYALKDREGSGQVATKKGPK